MEEVPLRLLRISASSLIPRSFLLAPTILYETEVHSSDIHLSNPIDDAIFHLFAEQNIVIVEKLGSEMYQWMDGSLGRRP
jgi:hypothetical protein